MLIILTLEKGNQMNIRQISKVVRNAKLQAIETLSGESLITAYEAISHIQDELLTEYLKNHTIQQGENFMQECNIED